MQPSTLLNLLSIAVVTHGACIGPAVNTDTVNLVSEFEGFRASPYIDATGHPTVGYGHLCQKSGCTDVKYPKPLSQDDGKKLLAQDLGVRSLPIMISYTILGN